MVRVFPVRRSPPGIPPIAALAVLCLGPACSSEVVSVLEVSSVNIQPAQLSLVEGESRSLSVVLRAAGGEVLGGRTVSWASLAPSVASVDPTGRVTAESPGEATIQGTSEGVVGNAVVTVLGGPAIALAPPLLSFQGVSGGQNPMEQQVAVTNPQGGVLSGLSVSVSEDPGAPGPWLEAVLLSATAPTSVIVTARATALPAGSYTGAVDVASGAAGNSPQRIAVALEVTEPLPRIRVVPNSVALSGVTGDVEPASLAVDVENAGAGSLGSLDAAIDYADGEPQGWLEAELASAEAPTTLILEASPRFLVPGVYHAVVEVSSPDAVNGSDTVEVVFTVAPRDGLEPGSPGGGTAPTRPADLP